MKKNEKHAKQDSMISQWKMPTIVLIENLG